MGIVLLVTREGCSPCKRIRRIIEEVRNLDSSLQIQEVKFSSPDGMRLAKEYQILYPPGVFINGKLFGKGKIREDDLKRALWLAGGDVKSKETGKGIIL